MSQSNIAELLVRALQDAGVRGFGLWSVRAVLNGRGRELIDVSRTNLFR